MRMPAGTPSRTASPSPIAQPSSVLSVAFHSVASPSWVNNSPTAEEAGGMLVSGISPARTTASQSARRSSTATIGGAQSPPSRTGCGVAATLGAPDLLGGLDDQPQLGHLLVIGEVVALRGGGEPALRRQAQ